MSRPSAASLMRPLSHPGRAPPKSTSSFATLSHSSHSGYLRRLPPRHPRAHSGPGAWRLDEGNLVMTSPMQVLARLTAAGVTGGLLLTGLTALPATADDRPLPAGRTLTPYTVKPGDTATGLAVRFHAWTAELISHNHLGSTATLRVGQRIEIPVVRAAARKDRSHRAAPTRRHHRQATQHADRHTGARHEAHPRRAAHPGRAHVRRVIVDTARRHGVDPQLALAVVLAGVRLADAPHLPRPRDRRHAGAARHRHLDVAVRRSAASSCATPATTCSPACCCSTCSTTTPGPAGTRWRRTTRASARSASTGSTARPGATCATSAPSTTASSGACPRPESREATPRRTADDAGPESGRSVPWTRRILPHPAAAPEDQAVERTVERDLSDPMVGRLLDRRYRIGPRIARGGMASVYEATDVRLDRVVAIKIMHPGMGDDDGVRGPVRPRGPARRPALPPHVVGVFDQGEEDGTVYLAMEYVPGHTLRDVIRKESPMPATKALALIEPILSALAAAHQAGIIHRDIKPENVLIADDGRVKVADFGLARAVSADTQHTATGGRADRHRLLPRARAGRRRPRRRPRRRLRRRGRALRAAHRPQAARGRLPHPGRLQARPRGRAGAVRRWCPGSRRTSTRWSPGATARDRSHRPADARVLLHQVHRVRAGARRGRARRPRAGRRPGAAAGRRRARARARRPRHRPRRRAGARRRGAVRPRSTRRPRGHRPARSGTPTPARIDRRESSRGAPPGHAPAAGRRRPVGVLRPAAAVPPRPRCCCWWRCCWPCGGGAGAWYFGFDRYTSTPGVIGLTEAQAEARMDRAGLGFEVGGHGVLRDRRRPAR